MSGCNLSRSESVLWPESFLEMQHFFVIIEFNLRFLNLILQTIVMF